MKIETNNSFLPQKAQSTQHDELVDKTRKWVSQTFFGTLLKQMRNSPFRSEMFDGGRGGQAFGQLFDQKMTDHLAKATGGKLVNSIVKRLEANMQKKTKSPAGGENVSTIA